MVMMMRGRRLRQLSGLSDDDNDDEYGDNASDHYYDDEDDNNDILNIIILLLLLIVIIILDVHKRMINIGISERVSRMFSGRTYGMPFI